MAVSNDLVTDRRVARNASALREAGFEVRLLGVRKGRLAPRRGWVSTWARKGAAFYAEYNLRLWWHLVWSRADILWANDADTLAACALAARRRPWVADMHELMSEVPEVQGRPRVQRVWRRVERAFLPRAAVRFTVCQGLADFYRQACGVGMTVVRNMPADSPVAPLSPVPSEEPPASLKTLLYQGAVNLGRGVDWAIEALGLLPGCRLVVAGDGDELEAMRRLAAGKPWRDRVSFLGRVAPVRLRPLMAGADVGLVMLEDKGLNYHFALPNRVGDFIAAGLPMVVSDLPEMASVVRRYGVGEVLAAPGPEALAAAVRRVLDRCWTAADFAEARRDFDWNREKQKMITAIEKLTTV